MRPGDRLGPYELQRKLALGGMAEIWSARSTESEGILALKFLKSGSEDDASLRTMFLDECRLATGLRHPNIVRVFGGYEIEGQLFQAMELLEGQDIRRLLVALVRAEQKMPVEFSVSVARDVARALGYAHHKCDDHGAPLSIVHRDVSPQNVMLLNDGGVRVLDFGIARAKARLTKTKTGVIKGKVPYMAPEQAMAQAVSAQTDIFALGVVLWEMLAMRRLFTGRTDIELFQAVCEARVPPIREYRDDVPESLSALVHEMLSRTARQRPPSMREVEDRLSRVLVTDLREQDASAAALAAWVQPYIEARRRTAVLEAPVDLDAPAGLLEEGEDATESGAFGASEDSARALELEEPSAPWLSRSPSEPGATVREDGATHSDTAPDGDSPKS